MKLDTRNSAPALTRTLASNHKQNSMKTKGCHPASDQRGLWSE